MAGAAQASQQELPQQEALLPRQQQPDKAAVAPAAALATAASASRTRKRWRPEEEAELLRLASSAEHRQAVLSKAALDWEAIAQHLGRDSGPVKARHAMLVRGSGGGSGGGNGGSAAALAAALPAVAAAGKAGPLPAQQPARRPDAAAAAASAAAAPSSRKRKQWQPEPQDALQLLRLVSSAEYREAVLGSSALDLDAIYGHLGWHAMLVDGGGGGGGSSGTLAPAADGVPVAAAAAPAADGEAVAQPWRQPSVAAAAAPAPTPAAAEPVPEPQTAGPAVEAEGGLILPTLLRRIPCGHFVWVRPPAHSLLLVLCSCSYCRPPRLVVGGGGGAQEAGRG